MDVYGANGPKWTFFLSFWNILKKFPVYSFVRYLSYSLLKKHRKITSGYLCDKDFKGKYSFLDCISVSMWEETSNVKVYFFLSLITSVSGVFSWRIHIHWKKNNRYRKRHGSKSLEIQQYSGDYIWQIIGRKVAECKVFIHSQPWLNSPSAVWRQIGSEYGPSPEALNAFSRAM